MISLGYTGWGPDQLNDELSDNAWMTFPENVDLIFKISPKQVDEMSKILGYDIRMINPGFGNAKSNLIIFTLLLFLSGCSESIRELETKIKKQAKK